MMKICFGLCAALCFGAVYFHEIIGTDMMLPPLASTDLKPDVIWLFHFSWHADSVLMLGMGTLFACAAFIPHQRLMGFIATGMSLGLGVTALGFLYDPIIWETPAPTLWTLIPLIGIVGLLFKEKERKYGSL